MIQKVVVVNVLLIMISASIWNNPLIHYVDLAHAPRIEASLNEQITIRVAWEWAPCRHQACANPCKSFVIIVDRRVA